jgi:hypothetical protein
MTRSEISTQPEPVTAPGLPEDRSSMTSTASTMSCAAEFPGADVSSATDGARTIATGQSRTQSLLESIANVIVGYGVAVVTQIMVFPVFGLHTTLAQNLQMGAVFTVVSIARSYVLRRLFEKIRVQRPWSR